MPTKTKHGSLVPKMEVKFPTFVTLHNPRLCVFYFIVTVLIIGFAVYQFIMGKTYEIEKLPTGMYNLCTQLCQRDSRDGFLLSEGASVDFARHALTMKEDMICFPYGQNPPPLNYKGYQGQCQEVCSSKVGWPCIPHGEHVQYAPTDIFVTTMVKETLGQSRSAEITSQAGCQDKYTFNPEKGTCEHIMPYYVRGFTDQVVAFDHEVLVPRPTSSIFATEPDKRESSKNTMATIVMNAAGESVKEFNAGEQIKLTVREVLEWAIVDDGLKMGSVDAPYTSEKFGVDADPVLGVGPTLRTTGARVRIDTWYTNAGGCQRTPDSEVLEKLTDTQACISIYLRRSWTSREGQTTQLADGSSVRREYHGLEFTFYSRGQFKFTDYGKIFNGLTKIFIWAGIPVWILYFFVVIFLGNLSKMYSRIIHQELSLSGCCIGLAARLMTHSICFGDLADTDDGITKRRLVDRFGWILQAKKEFGEEEVTNFINYAYQGIAYGDDEYLRHEISLQAFCNACLENEALTFENLVEMFDRDRGMGVLEAVFQDKDISTIRSVNSTEKMRNKLKIAATKPGGAETTMKKGNAMLRFASIESEIDEMTRDVNALLGKQGKMMGLIRTADAHLKEAKAKHPK